MADRTFDLRPIGTVHSPLTDPATAPKQGTEGGADAWLAIEPDYLPALTDIALGDRLIVVTWLDRADRSTLRVHPRDDPSNPETGVFSTRSADRPNPIGLHEVGVLAVEEGRIRVSDMEAVDGTPILDLKLAL